MSTPGDAARIDVLLEFLPFIESGVAGEWQGGERRPDGSITAPWMSYDNRMLAFIRACGQHGWLEPFDWMAWLPEAERYHAEPAHLATADIPAIRKLLTLHVRRDRFVEGHLAAMVEGGQLAAILHRLRDIRLELR